MNTSAREQLERELEELDARLAELSKQSDRKTSFFSPDDHELFRKLERTKAGTDELPGHIRDVLNAAERARESIDSAYCKMPQQDEEARSDVFTRLLDAKSFIEENFSSDIDLAEMAKQAAISEFYFVRLFKRAFGLSPYQYLLSYRLKRSAELLVETELPIYEVARLCGFESHITFSTQFRGKYKSSPSRYRMMGTRQQAHQ
jgi:AraC-like DNA-binding protein